MKKKILSVGLSVAVCVVLSFFSVSASGNALSTKGISERYSPCSGGGKHAMYGRGSVTAFRGSAAGKNTRLFNGGTITQCVKCLQVLATEQNPYWKPRYLGWYTMHNGYNTDIGTGHHSIYSNNYWYNSNWAQDKFFRSFDFFR